jgi:hypothetical protein
MVTADLICTYLVEDPLLSVSKNLTFLPVSPFPCVSFFYSFTTTVLMFTNSFRP